MLVSRYDFCLTTARHGLSIFVKADFEQTINDLSYKLEEKNEENVRLRMQRNQLQAEVNERKARDSIKFASLQEYKSSMESNSVRK
jgi:E3 ubiquitin-protein ligase BRE1